MLAIKYQEIKKIIPYVNNSRTHSDHQIKQVMASIKEFGFTNPILVDESYGVIAGHGRLLAAEILEMDKVPTIMLKGLTKAQRKAYIIADNQLALNSGWDIDLLKLEIDNLKELDFDLDFLGFDNTILGELITNIEPNFDPATEDEQGKLDELDPKWVDCPNCGKQFDLRGKE